ncbi:hypothetical protein NGM10_02490 [Halorussus salilacus]|uniref:antitoxin VapB family protein n=1 Tax=Halorussus salilacus TaxID=2953750 RepID=UPI0020A1B5B2|nr:antitoxin VapB family protein [Halorussus salilacus]USZ68619.1 hypothetical protein NGM10_02490 [Halorussus salilacus]
MTKTIRVSEDFHEVVKAHKRNDETMEETLRRLMGGPSPDALAEVVGRDDETAAEMREAIERKRDSGRERRAELRERFE